MNRLRISKNQKYLSLSLSLSLSLTAKVELEHRCSQGHNELDHIGSQGNKKSAIDS